MSNERDEIINAAIRDRKIRASQADDMRRLYDSNPDAMRNLLTAPVRQGGLLPGIVAAEDGDVAPDGYDVSMLTPSERARVAQAQAAAGPPAPAAPVPAAPRRSAGGGSDAYDESLLSPAERDRIAAIKAGTFEHDRIVVDQT